MSKYLPEKFDTEIANGRIMTITAPGDTHPLMVMDLKWLANKMLNGGILSRQERAVAGATVLHCLAMVKGEK